MPALNHVWIRFLPPWVRSKLEGRTGLQGMMANTGWLFAYRVLQMGVGLVVGVMLARYLGPQQYGQLNYASAFAVMFLALSTLGLDSIVVRELVREPSAHDQILGTTCGLKLAGGTVAFLLSTALILMMRPDERLTQWMVGIMAASMVFQALDTIDLWFQSQVQSRYAVIVRSSVYLAVSLAKLVLIKMQAPLIVFAWAFLALTALGSVGLILPYRLRGFHFRAWSFRLGLAARLLAESWPLFLASLAMMISLKIGTVMLGQMSGDAMVGIYSAAARLSELWYFIPAAIASSVAPAIMKLKIANEPLYYRRLQQTFNLMAVLAYALAVPLTFLAHDVVRILYGPDYQAAGAVLVVQIWQAVFGFQSAACGIWIIAEGLTVAVLASRGIGAVLNVLLNIWLIPRYGALGAAWAAVAAEAVAGYGFYLLVPYGPFNRVGGMMTRALGLRFLYPQRPGRASPGT